jgi:surfeit locus 1 family protein
MTLLGFRPALGPTLFTLPALLVLLALGTWQLERLAWKRDLIARLETRVAAAPVALPAGPLAPEEWEYRRVSVEGRFLHEGELHLLAHNPRGSLGYQVITPLERADGGGFVLVNRGWVPTANKDPATRGPGQVAGTVKVGGVVRKSWRRGWFVPDNEPGRNLWFFADVPAMLAQAGLSGPPLFVEADAAPNPGGLPVGGQTRLDIPNNHLQYALTWYGFAVALVVIYVLWHRRRAARSAPA